MRLANIQIGIFATLTASGPYAASEISSCSFAVLEAVSGCAVMFLPGPDTDIEPNRFGLPNSVGETPDWDIQGVVYVKDLGQSEATLSRVWQAIDDIYNTFKKDKSLGGNVGRNGFARLVRVGWTPGQFIGTDSGQVFAPVRWRMKVSEVQ